MTPEQIAAARADIHRAISAFDAWERRDSTRAALLFAPRALDALEAAQRENADLRAALAETTHCETCDGTGEFSVECVACLVGEGGACHCADMPLETCPQCDGKKRDYRGSALAEAYYAKEASRG